MALNWNLQKGFLVLVGIRSVEQVTPFDASIPISSLSLSLSTTVSMAQPLIRFQYVHLLALHFSCVDTSWLPVGIFGRCSISIASATATASLSLCISLSIYLSYDVISPCRHTSFHHHVTLPCCQAKENLGAAGWSLSPAEVETLDRAAAKVPKQLIQNSFQTK